MWLRNISIRVRMRGTVVIVLGLFALVGVSGLLGGRQLASLNTDFMHHSLNKVRNVGAIRHALGEVRTHEKDMIIHYEDGVAVLKSREAWAAAIKRAKTGLEAMLEGEEDDDNPIARASIQELDAYVTGTAKVLEQVQNGAYDTALAADKMLARAKGHAGTVEKNLDAIDKIVDREAADSQAEFSLSMQHTLWQFAAVLVLAVLVVVPLTMLNSHSIIRPMQQARDVALAIAEGDLTRTVQVDGQDEAAELLRALARPSTPC